MCKNLLKRSKKGKVVFYCKERKEYIDYKETCCNCPYKCYKEQKPLKRTELKAKTQLKKSTNKLRKLENNRTSILTENMSVCFICGKAKKDDIHEIYGGCNRIASMKNGCCIPVCRSCHQQWENDPELRQKYYDLCREKFCEMYGFDKFMHEFGRSYK